jgi:hypothetical protein
MRDPRVLAVAFVVLALLSGLAVVVGTGSDRAIGLAGLLLFGGGGLTWAFIQYGSRGAGRLTNGTIALRPGAHVPALIVPVRAGAARAAVLGGVFLSASVAVLFLHPDGLRGDDELTRWVLAGCGLVMAVLVVAAVPRLRGPAPIIALTPTALVARAYSGTTVVPWAVMARVGMAEVSGQAFLGLAVTAPEAVERDGFVARFGSTERAITGWDVALPLLGLGVAPEVLVGLVTHHTANPDDRQRLGRVVPPIPNA